MADYVSPQVEAAAKSTRTEADVRELARAKVAADKALADHNAARVYAVTEEQQVDWEITKAKLARAAWDAQVSLSGAV